MGFQRKVAKFWGCSSVGRGKLLYNAVGRNDRKKKNAKFWGCSSVGRAPALQAGGRQFEPDQLHQNKMKPKRQERKERHLLGQPSPSRQFEPDQLHQNKRKGG